jgi:hypothetical protein
VSVLGMKWPSINTLSSSLSRTMGHTTACMLLDTLRLLAGFTGARDAVMRQQCPLILCFRHRIITFTRILASQSSGDLWLPTARSAIRTCGIVQNIDAEISRLEKARALLIGHTAPLKPGKRSRMSAEGRARIAAAQRKRWAKRN